MAGMNKSSSRFRRSRRTRRPHDVLMIADEGGLFGEYFPYRTWDARPVAGTQGLVPTSWHPALEQWGATQFQNRFRRLANRPMRPLDYDVWVAVARSERRRRERSRWNAADMIAHLKSADFDLAAFKGRKLTYRAWDGQLRQPILIATAKLPVTVSPQPGFLHQFSELDTLGIDKPETACAALTRAGCPEPTIGRPDEEAGVDGWNAWAHSGWRISGLVLAAWLLIATAAARLHRLRHEREGQHGQHHRQHQARGDQDRQGRPAPARRHPLEGREVVADLRQRRQPRSGLSMPAPWSS
mgnify:CR=1 FL=1